MFEKVAVTLRSRNTLFEIVAVAERYLIITHLKNKESKISWWENVNNFWYNVVSLGKMARKTELFHKNKLNMNL